MVSSASERAQRSRGTQLLSVRTACPKACCGLRHNLQGPPSLRRDCPMFFCKCACLICAVQQHYLDICWRSCCVPLRLRQQICVKFRVASRFDWYNTCCAFTLGQFKVKSCVLDPNATAVIGNQKGKNWLTLSRERSRCAHSH